MKKIIILLSMFVALFAQGEQYEKNLNLGNSDTANYTIVKDDNLWDLAQHYYGNPYEWRYIWEHNRYIQDPHWIYPGNKLFIPAINGGASTGSVVSSENIYLYDTSKTLNQITDDANKEIKKSPTQQQLSLVEKFKYYFSTAAQRQAPFIQEYKSKDDSTSTQINIFDWGKVVDGNKPLLIQHKDARVKLNNDKSDSVKVGDRLDFYEVRNNLPIKGIKGSVIEPVATGVVKFIDGDNNVTIFVDKIWGLVSVGAKVAPERLYKSLGNQLTYSSLSDSLNANVIARMTPDVSLKPGGILFINKGINDGVSIGDHFTFYKTNNKSKHSDESFAEGLVIATENSTATIRITTASEYSSSSSFVGIRQGKIVAK